MFRMKRTCCVALALLLSVLLLPLPAMAGGFGDSASTALSWDGLWADLLAWFGLGPEADSSSYIDPDGKPYSSSYIDPNGRLTTAEDSSSIDPNGQPKSSSYIDPLGKP